MPNGGTMWHCYECNAEMRPLMMPDPHCASCNSTFVEMIENEADDPRNFQVHPSNLPDDDGPFGYGPFGGGVGPDRTVDLFQTLMMGLGGPQRRTSIRIDRRTDSNTPGTTISFGGGGGGPMMRGNVPPAGGFFIHTTPGPEGNADMTPLFATLLGTPPSSTGSGGQEAPLPPNPLRSLLMTIFGAPMGADGQYGDYAVTNEALDRIITQLMEQSNGDKPVPAPDDLIERLPHIKVTEGSDILTRDCAICKDDFELSQETIQLPCKHIFHDECILPWIKQSGTCPVCRHELVPQPKHAPGAPGAGGPGVGSGAGGSGTGVGGGNAGAPGSGFGGLFSMLRGNNSSGSSNNRGSQASNPSHERHDLPGGWHDLD